MSALGLAGALALVLGLAALLLAEGGRLPPALRRVAKPVASTGFLLLGLDAARHPAPGAAAGLAALALCWLGDALLIPASRRAFLAGLFAFLAGHLAWAASFLARGVAGPRVLAAAALAALAGGAAAAWLWRPAGAMRGPVLAYIAVIGAMVALAAGTADPRVLAGALLFYVSDLAVARDRFVRPGFANRLVGLPLYYGAQALLATALASRG